MPAKQPTVKFTYEDYLLIPDDGKRHEIIDGEEYVAPAPTTRHQRIIVRLLTQLYMHVEQHGLGEVYASPIDVILSETDIVQPDALFVSSERASIIEEHGLTGGPDLIAEVLSEGNRRHDEIRAAKQVPLGWKRKLYERYGVREYWIVDPELETVKVYRQREEGGYGPKTELSREGGEEITTPLLPDFALPLEALFS